MKNTIIIFILLIFLTSCEGYYMATGTVYEKQDNIIKPLDSTQVKIYCGKEWLLGNTHTDSLGQFKMRGLTSPSKETYYFILEKEGYKTDTIMMQGKRGKSEFLLNHILLRNK